MKYVDEKGNDVEKIEHNGTITQIVIGKEPIPIIRTTNNILEDILIELRKLNAK